MYQVRTDAKDAAADFAHYLRELFHPPRGGAQLSSILGAYILKAVLRDAGFAIVPINPRPGMQGAFRKGLFKPFHERYDAMLTAAWPDVDNPDCDATDPIPK